MSILRSISVAFWLSLIFMSSAFSQPKSWDELLSAANQFRREGSIDSALYYGEAALEAARRQHGSADSSVALVYHRLGVFHHNTNPDSAMALYKKALWVWRDINQPNPADLAKTLNNIAVLHGSYGRYIEAKEVLTESLQLKEQFLDPYDVSLSSAYNNLGDIYRQLGMLREAEYYLEKAWKIRDSVLPDSHSRRIDTMHRLGHVAYARLDVDEALRWYTGALSALADDADPPTVAGATLNVATAHLSDKNYDVAESLLVGIYESGYSNNWTENDLLGLAANNLGLLYVQTNNPEAAVQPLLHAADFFQSTYDDEHPEYARALVNLARAYTDLNIIDSAHALLQRSLKLRERVLGEQHPHVAYTLWALGDNYLAAENYDAALTTYRRSYRLYQAQVQDYIPYLPERDAIDFIASAGALRDRIIHTLLASGLTEIAKQEIARLVVNSKRLISEESQRRHALLHLSKNAAIKTMHDSLVAIQNELFRLTVLNPMPTNDAEQYSRISQLSMTAESLESQIASELPDRGVASTEPRQVDIESIQKTLSDNQAVIEYLKYSYPQDETIHIRYKYLAAIIDRGSVEIVDLGEAAIIDSAVSDFRNHFQTVAESGTLPDREHAESYRIFGSHVSDLLYRPLMESIAGHPHVFVAADDAINFVSFGSLPLDGDSFVIENKLIQYISSSKDLLTSALSESGTGFIAFADPSFESHGQGQEIRPAEGRITRQFSTNLAELRPLPETREECEMVARDWEHLTGETAAVYYGDEASESRARQEIGGKRVVYFATHGFFAEEARESVWPMLRNGLYLAPTGGNSGDATQDGFLTAAELLAFDLRGVNAVVLSACETAAGVSHGGEGVFGLRRAFNIAGARYVVSALWQVDSRTTATMMSELFKLSEEESLVESIRRVQLRQIERNHRLGFANHPYTWGGFIVTGD